MHLLESALYCVQVPAQYNEQLSAITWDWVGVGVGGNGTDPATTLLKYLQQIGRTVLRMSKTGAREGHPGVHLQKQSGQSLSSPSIVFFSTSSSR